MLLISIPKPCHENWNEMSPGDKGRFCQVCSKTVVDFTSMTEDNVKNYFLEHAKQKTCGRFRKDQLISTDTLLPRLLQTPIPFWKKFLAIVLILFGNLLSSCHTSSDKTKQLTLGEPETTYSTNNAATTELDTIVGVMKGIVEECSNKTVDTIMVETGEIVEVIIEEDIACGGPPSSIDTIQKKTWDKHGREISKSKKGADLP